MNAEPRRHVSYLLRLWQTQSDGRSVWRASLEDPYSGRRRGFAGLPELLAYLEQEIACVDGDGRQSVECSDLDTTVS
jgi:hypothetical protein